MTSILNRRKALLGGAAAIAALSLPAIVAAESSPDPVFGAIDHHRFAWANIQDLDDPDHPDWNAGMQAETDAWIAFANTRATTGAGLVAFANYAAAHPDLCEGTFRQPQPLLRTIEASVRQMGTPVPVDLKALDAELVALGAEFDRLDAAIAETNALLKPTDAEAHRLCDERPDVMKFTGRDFLWFGSASGNMEYWSPYHIDALKPYVPQSERDKPNRPNARIAELKAAREAWANRNIEFSFRTGRGPLLQRRGDLYRELNSVERRIVDQPAAPVSGLVVKAKAAKRESALWAVAVNDLDYDQQFYRDLIDNVLALAGMPA